MVISHNILGMNAQRQFNIVGNNKKKSTEKLSSGFKINRAADDAAGLTISEKMRSQIRGLSQGIDNTQDGVSLCQVADGTLEEVSDMLHRITELSVKSANGTNTAADRQAIQSEITSLIAEIDRVSESTQFNETDIFKPTIIKTGTIMSQEEAMAELSSGYYRTVSSDITNKTGDIIISKDAANTLFAVMHCYYGLANAKEDFDNGKDLYDGKNGEQTKKLANTMRFGAEATNACLEYVDKYVENKNACKNNINRFFEYAEEYQTADDTRHIDGGSSRPAFSVAKEYREGILGLGGIYTSHSWYSADNRLKSIAAELQSHSAIGAVAEFAALYYYENGWGSGLSKETLENNVNIGTSAGMNKYLNIMKTLPLIDQPSVDETLEYYTNGLSDRKSIADLYVYLLNDGEISVENKKDIWIQSGAKAGDGMYLTIDAMNTNILGIKDLDASTVNGALQGIDKVKNALNKVNANRSSIGAQQNRLEHTIANESNIVENTTAAESRIRDTDMAKETANLAVQNILTQAGVAIMSQANQSAQGVLQLLQ